MKLPAHFDDLVSEAAELKLYAKLVKQLKKDFLLANIDLSIEDNIMPLDLRRKLQDVLFKLIRETFAEYLNLLYIIDVSEDKIKHLDGSNLTKLSEEVTFLVLQREWQKVWYREKYS